MKRLEKQLEEGIRIASNYHEQDTTCKSCRHFVPADCSGSQAALSAHCTVHRFYVRVAEHGTCDFFSPRKSHVKADDR